MGPAATEQNGKLDEGREGHSHTSDCMAYIINVKRWIDLQSRGDEI